MSDTLVSTAWLQDNLDRPDIRVFDCAVILRPAKPGPYEIESGRAVYDKGHIPGAGFLDLTRDFSDPEAKLNFTKPSPAQMQAALSAHGIGNEHHAVLYSSTVTMWATRMYWMLRASGHDNVSVLDGGFAKWRAEQRAVSQQATSYAPTSFAASPRPSYWADRNEVLASIGAGEICTLNALSREVFTGESNVNYGRKGHIKGSVNVPYATVLNEDGTFKSPSELTPLFETAGALSRQRVICYCGGGISATIPALALTLLGHPNVAVYDGSMSEWVRDPSLPMEMGG